MKLVMDTNIYTDFAEGVPETVDFLATHGEQLFLPSIVMGELYFGFLKGRLQRLNEDKLAEFITRLGVEVVKVDENVARKYGLIYLSLKKKGKMIPINDVWIAACCMVTGGTLVTKDKHFELIDQIDKVILREAGD